MKISEQILMPLKVIFHSNNEVEEHHALTAEEVIEKIIYNLSKNNLRTQLTPQSQLKRFRCGKKSMWGSLGQMDGERESVKERRGC
jgi:hypothetical protein